MKRLGSSNDEHELTVCFQMAAVTSSDASGAHCQRESGKKMVSQNDRNILYLFQTFDVLVSDTQFLTHEASRRTQHDERVVEMR